MSIYSTELGGFHPTSPINSLSLSQLHQNCTQKERRLNFEVHCFVIAPKATWYFSDALDVHASLWYHWGHYAVSEGKSDTYAVEGNNAELRLARLARSSRCFSRCPYALYCAVCLFIDYFKQRQLRKHQFPKYSFHITDFVHSPLCHAPSTIPSDIDKATML
ncbi:MAG TPA: hypothetical protein VJ785_07675 [Anaerolineales bacterium]|nr:hypothetical protein [Anaerolineales bacterium]